MDEEERLRCREFARSLNFTDAQYEEAIRRITSPTRATDEKQAESMNDAATNQKNSTNSDKRSLESSSCYSSLSSLPSSCNNSLSSIQEGISLKPVYIDGANVARSHLKEASFSWQGIKLSVDWFKSKGHRVKVFVPEVTCRHWPDEGIISYLNELDALVLTPAGCNDDLFVINAARKNNAVIVSNDQYRNEKRLDDDMAIFVSLNRLPFVFVDDLFLPAEDPLGRSGPYLQEFLRADIPSYQYPRQYLSRHKCGQRRSSGTTINRQNSANKQPTYPSKRSLESTKSLPSEQRQSHESSWDAIVRHNQKWSSSRQDMTRDQERQTIGRSTSYSAQSSHGTAAVHRVFQGSGLRETRTIGDGCNIKSLCRTKSHDS